MSAYADAESYQEMINALNTSLNNFSRYCSVMAMAGRDCVDNTMQDPAAVASSAKLAACLQKIRGTFPQIQAIITALQQEIIDIETIAAQANSSD